MSDVVITESFIITDDESHDLANKFREHANATDSVSLGGSHYSIAVSDGAAAQDSFTGGRKQTVSVADGAASSDANDVERGLRVGDTAAAGDSATVVAHAAESVADTANASDAIGTPAITASYADTAAASDAVSVRRATVAGDAAAAADSVTVQRRVTASVSDGAATRDTQQAPLVVEAGDSAQGSDTATGTRIVEAAATDSANVADTVSAAGHKAVSITDGAGVTDAASGSTHATYLASDSADVVDRARTNAEVYGNVWTNAIGALALWEGLPFSCLLQDSENGPVYGAGDYGLYVMGADKDAGTPVASRVTYDLMDFGSPQRKRWVGIYALGASDGPYKVDVVSNQGTFRYTTQPTREREAVQHRVTPGRGLDSVKYRIDVRQTKPHSTEQVIAELENIARRI